MTIEYSSTRRELASWYWYSLRHNPKHLAAWLVCLLAVGFYAFVAEHRTESTVRAAGSALLWALGAALFLALYPQMRFKSQARTLVISPAGISTSINGRSKEYRWSDVASVLARDDQVYLGFKNLNAFSVPARAFTSAEARLSFIRLCDEWRQASTQSSAA